ncbi:hypothetical protein P7C70_g5635, partial [Phenoliferia sp. Uapishka_3]
MTSFNLPEFNPLPTPSQSRHKRSSSRHRANPGVLGPRFDRLAAVEEGPPTTPNSPAHIKSPHNKTWSAGRQTWRSPLALSESSESPEDVARRLRYFEWISRAHPSPSKRYGRPANTSHSGFFHDFSRTSLPRGPRGGDGDQRQQDAFYEEMVARSIERKLRDKVGKSKLGERAGLGVAAGREMYMLAVLGSVRESRLQGTSATSLFRRRSAYCRHFIHPLSMTAAAKIPSRPMSAPPTRQTFSIESSPLHRDPRPSALQARALGHRKASSSSATMPNRSVSDPTPGKASLGTGGGASTLVTIRGFIARRSASLSNFAIPMIVVEEPTDDIVEKPSFHEFNMPAFSDISLSPPGTSDEASMDVDSAALLPTRPPPYSAPPTQTSFSFPGDVDITSTSSSPRKRKESSPSASPSLPQRPAPAARPPTQRRHSTLGIPTLPSHHASPSSYARST